MEPAGERIRVAAVELFAERGFHGTGIRDLADRAGLSSATLYHYMGTKEDLLVRIMRESLERLLAAGLVIAADGPPRSRLVGLVHLHVRTHATWRLETRVVDDEMRALSAGRRSEIVVLRDQYEEIWQQTIEAGRRDGDFHLHESRVARRALLEMCSGIARWYQPQGQKSLDELAMRYAEMALGLLGSEALSAASAAESADRSRRLVEQNWPSAATIG